MAFTANFNHPVFDFLKKNVYVTVRCTGNFKFIPTQLINQEVVEETPYWCSQGEISVFINKESKEVFYKEKFVLENYNTELPCEKQLYEEAKKKEFFKSIIDEE